MNDQILDQLVTRVTVESTRHLLEIAQQEKYPDPRVTVGAAYGLGMQFALELAMLDPELARQVLLTIHGRQPDATEAGEHNRNAIKFIQLARATG